MKRNIMAQNARITIVFQRLESKREASKKFDSVQAKMGVPRYRSIEDIYGINIYLLILIFLYQLKNFQDIFNY